MLSEDSVRFVVMGLTTAYFGLWAVSQIAMGCVAAVSAWRRQHRESRRARALVHRVSTPLVSIVVPAHNEELTIVESVRALLAMEYEPREIVVVNDGSSDGTLAVLQRTFQLLAAPVAYAQPLPSAPVRAIYRSALDPALVVIDKENGGSKSDASNAGINAATGELVLNVDADTILEPDALNRAVLPFLDDPRTIAVGAKVGVVNGCRVENGRIVEVALPRSWFARLQIIEYMRAFLLFRVACAASNSLLILSGAFGLFRREAVLAVGGFDRTAIGEDMDLTIRLHRYYSERRLPFRIAFDPTPLCSTQAPEDWRSLRSQRWRWRRGLLQVIWRHRVMIGNPRYGFAGVGSFPYTIVFEALAPMLELTSYVLAAVAVIAGGFEWWPHYAIVVVVWSLFGTSVSMMAVLLNDVVTRRYMTGKDLALLVMVAVMENIWYRQLNVWWGFVGTIQAITGKSGWGAMKRQALGQVN